jgi:hypothetical protein
MQCHYCENTIDSEGGIRLGESDLFFCHSCYTTYQIKETKMKYYLDTEFIEGPQQRTFFGIHYANTKPTIDLISIGIVAEDGREYYEISKDFNLKEAWNRYQLEPDNTVGARIGCLPTQKKVYWIRENILKPIFEEFVHQHNIRCYQIEGCKNLDIFNDFTYKNLKALINKYGKTNERIALELQLFCNPNSERGRSQPEFYAYYADYDWVVFCWIFGKMIDLPKGFPWYCRDLKQILDEKQNELIKIHGKIDVVKIKEFNGYPKQTNEHNALDDAIFNKALHNFLNNI